REGAVEPPPALIALERTGCPDIEPEPRALDDDLGERRHVAEPDIETLPGKRMDGVGSVADKRQPLGHEAAGDLKVERERLARTGKRNVAELGAEALGKLGEECRLISGHDRFARCFVL